jgi:hypothetical protein
MPKKGLTAVKVTFMTMTLVTLVTAVKFDYGTVQYCVLYPANVSRHTVQYSTVQHSSVVKRTLGKSHDFDCAFDYDLKIPMQKWPQ